MHPDYHLFAQVVAAGSLSGAARTLRLSPSMVSKRLARLEARLGARLLHRTTRRLVPTPAGERFHADVVAILCQMSEAEARVSGAGGQVRGSLRVTAPTAFGRLHVAPHLAGFLSAYPEVTLDLTLSDDFADLIAARIDVAIRITDQLPPSLSGERLAGNRRVLCAHPDYLARHGAPATIDDLAQHRLLATAGQFPWRLTDGVRQVQVAGQSHVRTNSSEIVRALVIAGVGIGLRSLWDVSDDVVAGRLRRVLAPWEGPSDLSVYAVRPAAALVPPTVAAFIDHMRDRLAPARWNAPAIVTV